MYGAKEENMKKGMWKNVAFFSGTVLVAGWIVLAGLPGYAYQSNPIQSTDNAESHKEFLFVYNEDNVAHEVGDVVVLVTTPTLGTLGLSISTTTTAADAHGVGIVYPKDCAANSRCQIQVRGYVGTINHTGTATAREAFMTSSTAELVVSTGTVEAADVEAVMGVILNSSSDGTTDGILFGR
jgi:hypothetical protein